MSQEQKALELIRNGSLFQAEEIYRILLKKNNVNFEVYGNLAAICASRSNWNEAKLFSKEALKLNPEYSEAYSNLGLAYFETGNLTSAIECYKKAIVLNNLMSEAITNLGNIYSEIGDQEKACILQKRALLIKKNDPDILNNLGLALFRQSKLSEAIVIYKKALYIKKKLPRTLYNLGILFQEEGCLKKALEAYKEALLYDCDSAKIKASIVHCESLMCDWSKTCTTKEWIEKLGITGEAINPYLLLAEEDDPYKHFIRSKRYFKKKFERHSQKLKVRRKSKVRIGYFSANYYKHPITILIAGLFNAHNRSDFEIYAYAYGAIIEDDYTEKIRASVDIYRDIRSMDDYTAADLARRDSIDIAIDLTGYTQGARLSIFALRIAPIQITYLGYPGTIGSNCFDYIIADNTLVNNNEQYFSEKIIYMQNCYQCNDSKRESPKNKFTRRDLNLPEKGFIFTCFNANFKINYCVFSIWMKLLHELEGSVLWLYKSNSESAKNLCVEAEKLGISSSRIIFAENMPISDHLARHLKGDLFLDTFNYNAHTTATDALWSGLPILTKAGNSFSSRVCTSLLKALNLNELITYSDKEYYEKACWLAREPNVLEEIKKKLIRERMSSPLFDTNRFTSELEYNYKKLIRNID